MTSTPGRILVLGGTGFVGSAVCRQLAARGVQMLVPTRRLAHGTHLRVLSSLELVEADLHDDRALAHLVAQADAVVQLVAILHGSAAAFAHVHVDLPRRLAHACVAAGVRRVVHLSAIGAGLDAPSNYLRSKTEGEAALRAGVPGLTLLRPSLIFGADDRALNLFAQLQAFAPVMPLACSSARFQPVWVEDVACAVLRCLERGHPGGATYEIAGPSIYTLSELVRLAGRWSGHERPQIALPPTLGWLQALAMEWLPGAPLMSRDNLDSMSVPSIAGGTLPGLRALGITPTALEAVAPGWLDPRGGRARLERWRQNAHRI